MNDTIGKIFWGIVGITIGITLYTILAPWMFSCEL